MKKETIKRDEFFTPNEVANLLNRTSVTIRDWIKKGNILGYRDIFTGRYIVPKSEVERVASILYRPVVPAKSKKPKK